MKHLKSFDLLSESKYSQVGLPVEIIKIIKHHISDRLFSQFIGTPWFGGLRLGDETPIGRPILLTWKEQTVALPFIYYTGNPLDTVDIKYEGKITGLKVKNSYKEFLDFEKKCFDAGWIDSRGFRFGGYNEERPLSYIYSVFGFLLENYRRYGEKFNIFDYDYSSLPEMKQLFDLGAKVVSTPIEKKNGTLSIEHPNVYRPIILQTTGYIRYKGVSGYITTKPELAKPLSKLEDIIPKLIYVKYIIIKNSLEKAGLSWGEINQALKSFSQDPENYSKLAQEIVQKYPSAVLYLPKPVDGFDQELTKGAKLMGRLGLF